MHSVLLALALGSAAALSHENSVMPKGIYANEDVSMKLARVSFEQFKKQYNKVYENNQDEEKHFQNFRHSLFRIINSNENSAAGITKVKIYCYTYILISHTYTYIY